MLFKSPKRNRFYERKFDYAEARRRHAAGETYKAIAQDLGVNKEAVRRACIGPETGTPVALGERPLEWRRNHDRCPTCQGWKTYKARQCAECHRDWRLGLARLQPVKGVRSVPVISVRLGSVVAYRGSFAVVEPIDNTNLWRMLHFWDGPPQRVHSNTRVDVERSWRVITEDGEEFRHRLRTGEAR